MALIKSELKITKLKDLLYMNLVIPLYQRPYSWSVKLSNTLFGDTYEAFRKGINEYRLGSVILHKDNKKYNIVDGQQRLTTIAILLYCLGEEGQKLLKEKYSGLSNDTILINFSVLSRKVNELSFDEQKKYKEYLLNQCTLVQVVTDSEQEAFQFFDSQNSRGKELAPHDLLKSYHLREMNNKDESEKIKVINSWENINQEELEDLFKNYLYPLIRWYKKKDGLAYSSNKIDSFKGIKGNNIYNYGIYHKASNLYVEQFNSNGNNELIATVYLNQFQLTEPLIAGKRFFDYILHYRNLLSKVKRKIEQTYDKELIPNKRSGDIYIKQLYECSLLFFADRFGIESLTKSVMEHLYSWSYSLRLIMYAVYPQTINNYARGQHEKINLGVDMFSEISEMINPEEVKLIALEKPQINDNNKEKYKEIYETIYERNRW